MSLLLNLSVPPEEQPNDSFIVYTSYGMFHLKSSWLVLSLLIYHIAKYVVWHFQTKLLSFRFIEQRDVNARLVKEAAERKVQERLEMERKLLEKEQENEKLRVEAEKVKQEEIQRKEELIRYCHV